MNTVKSPKKPLIFYYFIFMLALFRINVLLMPSVSEMKIEEVDYGTFITMTEGKQIDQVEIQANRILFTDKEGKVYKTGLMDDPNRTERLYASGAQFSSEIIEETSPLLSFFLSWVAPMLIIILLGQLLTRKLMKSSGGANSMMFNSWSALPAPARRCLQRPWLARPTCPSSPCPAPNSSRCS